MRPNRRRKIRILELLYRHLMSLDPLCCDGMSSSAYHTDQTPLPPKTKAAESTGRAAVTPWNFQAGPFSLACFPYLNDTHRLYIIQYLTVLVCAHPGRFCVFAVRSSIALVSVGAASRLSGCLYLFRDRIVNSGWRMWPLQVSGDGLLLIKSVVSESFLSIFQGASSMLKSSFQQSTFRLTILLLPTIAPRTSTQSYSTPSSISMQAHSYH
jgi:hypothetical protein